jgi:hypothetical protein
MQLTPASGGPASKVDSFKKEEADCEEVLEEEGRRRENEDAEEDSVMIAAVVGAERSLGWFRSGCSGIDRYECK